MRDVFAPEIVLMDRDAAFLTHEEVLRIRDSSYETGEQIFMDGHVDNAEPVQV